MNTKINACRIFSDCLRKMVEWKFSHNRAKHIFKRVSKQTKQSTVSNKIVFKSCAPVTRRIKKVSKIFYSLQLNKAP